MISIISLNTNRGKDVCEHLRYEIKRAASCAMLMLMLLIEGTEWIEQRMSCIVIIIVNFVIIIIIIIDIIPVA